MKFVSVILDVIVSNIFIYSLLITGCVVYFSYLTGINTVLFVLVFICSIQSIPIQPTNLLGSIDFVTPILEKSLVAKPTVHFEKEICEQTIFIYSPHGFLPLGIVWLFGSTRPFSKNTYLLVSKQLMNFWLAKLLFLIRGNVLEISQTNIEWCLKNGHSVLISLGGIREMVMEKPMDAGLDDFCLYTGHERIFQIAHEHHVSITPILCDGQQHLHLNSVNYITRKMYKYFRVPIPLFLTNRWGLPISNRVPLTFYIGTPIPNCTKTNLYEAYNRLCAKHTSHRLFLVNKVTL